MPILRSVVEVCQGRGLGPRELAAATGLDERRVRAIVEGRWTPSPAEREKVAAAFGLRADEVAWGHTAEVEHLYGHGPQFGRTP
jgi:hypothetical protein